MYFNITEHIFPKSLLKIIFQEGQLFSKYFPEVF